MPYTSIPALTDRFGEDVLISLTDRADLHTGVIDADVVNKAIANADAIIDGYAGVRYALPMAETPPLIATLAEDIAIYKLSVYDVDVKIKDEYDAAIAMLKSISAGSVRLPIAGVETPGSGSSGARVTDRDRTFTESGMKGFIG